MDFGTTSKTNRHHSLSAKLAVVVYASFGNPAVRELLPLFAKEFYDEEIAASITAI